jgi:tetratricopeptide (TPR) repeat protein
LRAWNIAVAHGWFDQVVYLMQGIEELLRSQNRLGDFKRFVDIVEPLISVEFGPDPRWRLEWRFVQEYKARLAAMDRSLYTEAERGAALAALAAAPSGLDPQEALRTHAVGLNERGLHLLQRGDPAGLEFIEQSLAIARGLDDPQTFHSGLVQLASLITQLHDVPDYEKVEAMLEEAITAARERRQDRLQLEGLVGLAEALIRKVKMLRWRNVPGRELASEMGRIAAALGEAKPLVDLSGWPEATARHTMAVAESMLLGREYEPAMAAFSTVVELSSQDPVRAAKCMSMIGYCCQALDRPEAARDYFKAADELGKRHGFSLDPLRGETNHGSSPP